MCNLQKHVFLLLAFILSANANAQAEVTSIKNLTDKIWFSGEENCINNNYPAFETYQYDKHTYILRQNKCDHYEAPFIYLLFGEKRALLIDTGATDDKEKRPLAKLVKNIMMKRAQQLALTRTNIPLLIVHSHSHSDHIAGDNQFTYFTPVEIITPNDTKALITAFSFEDWPLNNATLSLGNRTVSVIPTPGHQTEAITFYDHQSTLLFTGDSIYPGRLYIRKWEDYKDSIQRLVTFSDIYPVAGLLGAHIEMSSSPNFDYPIEVTFQPSEASLVLTKGDLNKLNRHLTKLGDKPIMTKLGNMIIYPIK